jgi:hypothetical protein
VRLRVRNQVIAKTLFGIHDHCAELETVELFAAKSNALMTEDSGAGRAEGASYKTKQQQGNQHDDARNR